MDLPACLSLARIILSASEKDHLERTIVAPILELGGGSAQGLGCCCCSSRGKENDPFRGMVDVVSVVSFILGRCDFRGARGHDKGI